MLPAVRRRLSVPLRLLTLAVCSLLALTACAPAQQTGAAQSGYSGDLTPRPEGSPDVLLLAFSGRCPPGCHAPDDNIDYLTPRGTVQAVAAVLEARGLSVQTDAAASHLSVHTPGSVSQAQAGAGHTVAASQQGFVQLEDRLTQAEQQWVRGRSNPTRIVLLAHSHGVVWSHALARAHPEVQIAAMIDLDGVCDFWETDHRQDIQAYLRTRGRNPWGFDLADSCGSVRVGHIRYDVKDVVFPNVVSDLEVQSARLLGRPDGSFMANFPFDSLQNVRLDGSRSGIQTFRSASDTHSSVSWPKSRAMAWVLARLTELSADWTPATPTAPPVAAPKQ